MYPSTSSYRSSSMRFRQRQRASSWHSSTNSNSNLHDSAQSKPRAVSEDYSVASSVSSLHQQEQFQQQPQRQTQQRQSRASRESSMMVFLETLVRCFTTRRRRRKRGAGTRKMKNNNFETVDGSADSGSDASKTGNAVQRQPRKPYTAVPRNETEMYFMLRSKRAMSTTLASKPSIGTMATSSMASNNSASPPRRRQTDHHPYKAKPSTATRASSAPSTSTGRPRHIFIEHPNEDEPLLL